MKYCLNQKKKFVIDNSQESVNYLWNAQKPWGKTVIAKKWRVVQMVTQSENI